MGVVVMKFGGASVATVERFAGIADIIIDRKRANNQVVVVISAMGDTTDRLIRLAREVNPDPPRREYDMLITVGERISIALLAMALADKKQDAVSFTGSQSGILTSPTHSDARIVDVRPSRLIECLRAGKIAIVAGFQGVSLEKEITTLGRGGSDTSAVALAASLKADRVEFYKDVPGIYDKDPNANSDAKFLPALTYADALSIVNGGCRVLHKRCVKLAEKNNIPLYVNSFAREGDGTLIRGEKDFRPNIPMYENLS